MARYMTAAKATALLLAIGALAGCGMNSVNGSVSVAAQFKSGDVGTVNGSVTVGEGATVEEAMTVNGGVRIEPRATAKSVKTVNGEITLGESAKVSEGVFTVNGALRLSNGADVAGGIGNVNGDIRLVAAHVGGGIETVNGDIDVGSGSRVEGGIHVDKADLTDNPNSRQPRIVIGPGATVDGPLRFERPVKLLVSESATVSGPIQGATAEKFAGDQPPAETASTRVIEQRWTSHDPTPRVESHCGLGGRGPGRIGRGAGSGQCSAAHAYRAQGGATVRFHDRRVALERRRRRTGRQDHRRWQQRSDSRRARISSTWAMPRSSRGSSIRTRISRMSSTRTTTAACTTASCGFRPRRRSMPSASRAARWKRASRRCAMSAPQDHVDVGMRNAINANVIEGPAHSHRRVFASGRRAGIATRHRGRRRTSRRSARFKACATGPSSAAKPCGSR